MCYFCHAQLFEITYAKILIPFENIHAKRESCGSVVRCGLPLSTGASINPPTPVDALRVPAGDAIALSWAPCTQTYGPSGAAVAPTIESSADMQSHALAAATANCRDFVPWRFLVAVLQRVVSLHPATKTAQ